MSNDQTSSTSQIFYDGTYKTALSNYIITVTGGGQILVSDVNDWNKFVGIKPPTDSDVYANTRQLMLVYTKPTSGDAFDTANYSWISTDAGMLKFTKAWQLLSATQTGNFQYIDPPTTNETYYLQYVPRTGIQWTTIVNTLPFTPNVKSQIIGYDATANQAVNVTGTHANYVLQTTNANTTGIQFGYVTPATLNLNYQTIQGSAMVMAKSNNTFELSNMYPFSQNLDDGEIIFLDKTDPDNPFFNGIKATTSDFQMLYTYTNESGKIRWKYDYFNQAIAGLGQDTTVTEGKLAVWEGGRLTAKNIQELIGDITNYYMWSAVLQSSCYFCAANESNLSEIYTPTISLSSNLGKVIQNQFLTYGGNLELNFNLMLHCYNLKDYMLDDEYLDGVNISIHFAQCDSNSTFINEGIERSISIINVPVITAATPFMKICEYILVPFQFSDIPVTDDTKEYKFLPVELLISTTNDELLDVSYQPLQSKFKFALASKNIRQSFSCKKLYTFNN